MASLYHEITPQKQPYYDKKSKLSLNEWKKRIENSKTLYIGNLSFVTTEEQIWEFFSKCGAVEQIKMGLNRLKKTPCGFCFVEYRTKEFAEHASQYLSGAYLDDRKINVDRDIGFTEGRQWGRAESGGQWRDDFRSNNDPQRGGLGKNLLRTVEGEGKQIYVGEQFHSHGNVDGKKDGDKDKKGDEKSKKRSRDDGGDHKKSKKQKK